MKKSNGQQLSLFDITLEHTITNIDIEPPTVSEPITTENPIVGSKNLCPHPIPKVDDIIKIIDRSAYKLSRKHIQIT